MRLRRKRKKNDLEEIGPRLSRSAYVDNGWRIHPPIGYRFENVESSAVRITLKLKPE